MFLTNVARHFQKLFQTLLKIPGLTISLFLQRYYMNFENRLSFLSFHVKKSKACKICLLITMTIYIRGEKNKIVFIYFEIIAHFTHEDKFCMRIPKVKLYVTLENVME